MTTKELRDKLFVIENQDMTVRELRQLLFLVENQDAELKDNDLFKITRR